MRRGGLRGAAAWAVLFLAATGLVLGAGCAAHRVPEEARRPVVHVVLFWLNDPSDAGARTKLEESALSFRSIPGVESVAVGRALPSDRPVVDSSFDLGVVITFENPGALARYQRDPVHQAALRDLVKPLVKRMQVYDIVSRANP